MSRISNRRASDHGLTFRPLADTSRDTLAWWTSLPDERRAEPRAGYPADLEARVLKAWHESQGEPGPTLFRSN
ncbi:MAG TPA: hypothetical protein VMY18_00900 [Acidobacteriota bacterium]|nr:hypothetical protein [Acidobacteriota bacterium]